MSTGGVGAPEEEPEGCLQTDLFFEAPEGRKLAPKKREKGKNTDFGGQNPRLWGLTYDPLAV